VALLKKIENVDFMYDPALEKTNTNTMDLWVLASTQSLLQFVNQEMAAYRLYTVVPRLLAQVDNLTNVFIRFNRRRFKGELGVNDTVHALNTLFEVLFTLCRGLAPFIPFITENIYQRIRQYIPKELQGEDPRSVHFLPYPEVREELFNPVVERKVGRMLDVIALGRMARERRTISVKTPLRSLVVIHHDPQYLEDIKQMEYEITTELNILNLVLESDEEKYNITLSVSADWPVLGKKLRKDLAKVKKALPDVTTDQAKAYLETGKIEVAGIPLVEGDLVVRRGIKQDESTKDQELGSDNNVIILLDTEITPDLAEQGIAREIINRVQRLRKKAVLVGTDDVGYKYHVTADPDNIGLEKVFETQSAALQQALRRPMDKHAVTEFEGDIEKSADSKDDILIEESQEIQKATFLLRFIKL
jgi:isoleucyl-tRNA synthetase